VKRCKFCEQELPESGFTHYMVVETRVEPVAACCIACQKRLGLKVIGIRKEKRP
jgi:hypothetical protein